MLVGRRNLKNLLSRSSLLHRHQNLTNRIWIDTSSGGMRSINIIRSTQMTNLPLQESYPPLSQPHNPSLPNSGNGTFSIPSPYDDTMITLKAGSILLVSHWCQSFLWSSFRYALPGCSSCLLFRFALWIRSTPTHGRYKGKTLDKVFIR